MALDGTVANLHLHDEDLNKAVSYRHLCRIVGTRSNGLTMGKPVLDFCSVCYSWDTFVGPQFNRDYEEFIHRFETVLPNYFNTFRGASAELYDKFPEVDSLSFMDGFIEHVSMHQDYPLFTYLGERKTSHEKLQKNERGKFESQ